MPEILEVAKALVMLISPKPHNLFMLIGRYLLTRFFAPSSILGMAVITLGLV